MTAQTLEQLARQLGLDLDLVQRAQRQASSVDALAQAVRQVMAAFNLAGNWQIDIGQVDDCIVIGISGDNLGQGFEFALPVAESQASAQAQASGNTGQGSGNSGNSGNSAGSGSRWAGIFAIAEKYGVNVSQTEKRAVAWYLPEIVRRILKARPDADGDTELREIARDWIRNSKASVSRGIMNLMDLGFSSSI